MRHQFAAQFDCPAARVSDNGSGYQVQGCGRVARYRCISTERHDYVHDARERGASVGGALLSGLIGGMVEGALFADECFLEHAAPGEAQARGEALAQRVERLQKPAAQISERLGEDPQLTATVLVRGGRLEVLARPRSHPKHVLLTLHRHTRFDGGPSCQPRIFHDGVPLAIVEQRLQTPYAWQLALRLEQLRGLPQSVLFAGDVCGLAFELDEPQRRKLAELVARVDVALARRSAVAGIHW